MRRRHASSLLLRPTLVIVAVLGLLLAPRASALTFRVPAAAAGPELAGRSIAWAESRDDFHSITIKTKRGRKVRRAARFVARPDTEFGVLLAGSPRRLAYEVDEVEPARGN